MLRTPFALIGFLRPLVLLVVATSVAAAQTPAKGKVQKSVYHSPANNFSVPVPRGFKISDAHWREYGAVSFHDDFGGLKGIHYAAAPTSVPATAQEAQGKGELFSTWLHNFVLSTWFKTASPDSRILAEVNGTFEEMPVLFALIDAPGAHSLEVVTIQDGKMQRKREDSRRVAVIFLKDRYIYMLTTETVTLGLFETTARAEPNEDWMRRGDELKPFYHSIAFRQ